MEQPLQNWAQSATNRCEKRRLHRRAAGLLLPLGLLAQAGAAQPAGPMSVVEVIGKAPLAATNLAQLCQKYQVPSSSIYRWQNHLVAYGPVTKIKAMQQHLGALYPGSTVQLYTTPFYKFDRQRCATKTVAQQWDNVLLTANLVPDERKQREYLQYHATQFEKWPEVATGFCNASFQQLLVFRQGRQLMLVISIPHGASLEELNPRTTLNNPRVDDWNRLMEQYQQGLPGTKPGETWVFLKPVVAQKAILVKKQ
jgi:hypothetical protein